MTGKLNLMVHAGGHLATREQVEAVVTPQATMSWVPVAHDVLLGRVQHSLVQGGWDIRGEAHALSHENQRYFGLMEVGLPGEEHADYSMVIGLRNSHDKKFPAALCLGSQVFVCDNLAFSGEIKLARRHTRFIERDLPRVILSAVGQLNDHRKLQDRRISCYKEVGLNDHEANDIVIQALDSGVITCTKIPEVLQQWRTPAHPEFNERNAWSLFNGFTEVLKGNVNECVHRTQRLHGLMDSVCRVAV